jgi:hypothetical protein
MINVGACSRPFILAVSGSTVTNIGASTGTNLNLARN